MKNCETADERAHVLLDLQRGNTLAEKFCTGRPEEICMAGDDEVAVVEHLLHEVIHALSLQTIPGPGMVRAVDTLLAAFPDRGVWEEAKVLACEWHFFARCGRPLDMTDIIDTAYIQEVDKATLASAIESPDTFALLDRALAWARDVGLIREV